MDTQTRIDALVRETQRLEEILETYDTLLRFAVVMSLLVDDIIDGNFGYEVNQKAADKLIPALEELDNAIAQVHWAHVDNP